MKFENLFLLLTEKITGAEATKGITLSAVPQSAPQETWNILQIVSKRERVSGRGLLLLIKPGTESVAFPLYLLHAAQNVDYNNVIDFNN